MRSSPAWISPSTESSPTQCRRARIREPRGSSRGALFASARLALTSMEEIRVEEAELPGIGVRHDFLTHKGRRVGVIAHRSGTRDLLVYDSRDPDSCSETLALTHEE